MSPASSLFVCDLCSVHTRDGTGSAGCMVIMRNGEKPRQCVCSRSAEARWSFVKSVNDDGEAA